jgi:hypothetical protein
VEEKQMKRDLKNPLAATWPSDNGGLKIPKSTNLGSKWESKKQPNVNYWDPTGSNIKGINKKVRSGELSGREASAIKKDYMGDKAYTEKYKKPVGYNTKKKIAKMFKGTGKSGVESGSCTAAETRSRSCGSKGKGF